MDSSEGASENEEESDEDSESREWDEYCMICQDGGNVMCCEGCSNVAHFTCLNLKKQPNEWLCSDCKESKTKKVSKPKQTGGKSLRSAR